MNADPLVRQALEAFSKQDPEQAKTLLLQALEIDPGHKHAISNLGNLALLNKNLPAAEEHFQKALSIDAAFVPAAFGLAKALLSRKELDDALSTLQAIRENVSEKEQAEFYQLIGIILAGKEDFAAAIPFFEKYKALRPGQLDPLVCLHKAHLGNQDPGAAMQQLEEILAIDPSQIAVWATLATQCFNQKNKARLREICTNMLAAHPDNVSLFNLAAQLLAGTGQYAHAAHVTRRALDAFPDYDTKQYAELARMESLL